MAVNPQFKPAQIAKDLALKTKDITDILASAGITVKSGSALDSLQMDILWENITLANQIVNIEDYIDGVTGIPSLKKAVKAEPVKSETSAPEQDKNAGAEKSANPASASVRETEPKGEPASKAETSPKSEAAPKKESAPQKGTAPVNDGAASDGKPRIDESASGEDEGKSLQSNNVPAQTKDRQPVSRSAGERFESRMNAASQKGRAEPQKKQEQKPQKRQYTIEVRERTSTDPSEVVRVTAPKANTRVVDTRGTSSVDLSKYDEKLDAFVADSGRGAQRDGGRNKVKKNPAASAESAGQNAPRGKGQNQQKGQQGRDSQKSGQQGRNEQKQAQQPQNGKRGQQQDGKKGKRGQAQPPVPAQPVKKQPVKAAIPDEITVGEFAQAIKVTAAEVVKRLMLMGMMVTVNQTIDFDTAYLIGEELGAEVTRKVVVSIEDKLFDEKKDEDSEEDLAPRAPVVCVMGHVDHGKTSLLDAIRNTRVTAGEAGGITQHIGAYRVKINGREITFLDTPGHEAFTAMRARGAQATDIAILVVAADDGIMPQTVEAINHAKAAGVDIIVAINKMDKPGANPDAIKQELTKYELVPEEWGGDVMCVPVSALKRTGIDDLLESILLIADVKEYKANPNRRAKGIVIESRLDKGRGPVATVLIQNGTLHTGDIIIAGTCVGRVRAMSDYNGRTVKAATPSVPVEIVGLDDVPTAGDELNGVEDERMARLLADERRTKAKEAEFKANSRANLNDLFAQIQEGVKDLNIIVKADVGGSAEAVKQSLEKLSNDEVKVHVIHAAAGGITEGDVSFAAASSAIIVGFNVRPDKTAMDSADRQGVEIRTYRVIYECIEEIEAAMKGMLAPKFKESVIGHAEVRQVIHVPNVGFIAGSYVQDGKLSRSAQIRVVRDGVVIYEDKISSLRRFKDDVREVAQGYECGVGLEKFNDMKVGDILEAFVMEQIAAE